jgi:hypothetical protein
MSQSPNLPWQFYILAHFYGVWQKKIAAFSMNFFSGAAQVKVAVHLNTSTIHLGTSEMANNTAVLLSVHYKY